MRLRTSQIVQRIRTLYKGRFVPPHNDPGSPIVFLMGHYERPWLAELLSVLGRFWVTHWKWIITATIAIIGLIVAARG